MDQIPSARARVRDFNMEHFRVRLTARLCIIIVCLLVFIPRLVKIISDPNIKGTAELLTTIALPFPLFMSLVIVFEYFLYKKLGPGIVKYSTYVDLVLLAFFMADWILILIANLNKLQKNNTACFQISAVFGFTSFSWKTLLVTLIVQKWQLKIIAPVTALCVVTGYVLHYTTGNVGNVLLSAGTQLFDVIIIIYCEDKVKWKMVWANIQKDKWMQVNNFILNSIPENIILLDLKGETKFISEYCQSFIQKCHLPLDVKEFFKRIQDLQQQYELENQTNPSESLLQAEGLTTRHRLLGEGDQHDTNDPPYQNLGDIIENFKSIILRKEIRERQFLVYDGKLKIENAPEKSLEVKISFVQHFENCYIILMIRDTTQRDLLVALEETNKYKDQLLASVSHELRAPLNGNINLVESAVQSRLIPDNIKESLLIPALRSSKFLLHIINDILDMSQIKEKKLRLVFQTENLKETLRSTVQLVQLQAKKKGIEILLEIDPSVPTKFCTDHIRLSQIILNLLNNALKFTKEGQIKLTAKKTSDPYRIKITVEDSGIGMNQESVGKLFSSYTHIEFEGRQVMNPTGVGLGLNIAYNLALLLGPKDHKGITVISMPGQGSKFTFIIENQEKAPIEVELEERKGDSGEVADEIPGPLYSMFTARMQKYSSNVSAPIVDQSYSDQVLISPATSCSCAKVLIVDDNPFNTMAFETILNSLDVKCDSVYSGSACIKKLLSRESKACGDKCKQYDVIFMDQEMPEMSGSETVHEIKRLQHENLLSTSIKVIGCTAHKSKEEVDKFMETGIDQCIHKPISSTLIQDILKKIIAQD